MKRKIKNLYRRFLQRDGFFCKLYCLLIDWYQGNKVVVNGEGNMIHIPGWFAETQIFVSGSNNTICIEGEISGSRVEIQGSNCNIKIGKGSRIFNCSLSAIDNCSKIYIGDDCGIQRNSRVVSMEGHVISVGNNCMISYDVELRNSDAHSLLKVREDGTQYRTNPARDIVIGNNVWIAQQALLLKDVRIGDGSVIGAKSLVHKFECESKSVVAGNPARKVGEISCWKEERL